LVGLAGPILEQVSGDSLKRGSKVRPHSAKPRVWV
jgi:hypothetical protein